MKIESIIRRKEGTKVDFDACDRWPAGSYHFKPETDANDAPHVAEVDVPEHIERFLSISDAYRIAGKAPVPRPAAAPKPDEVTAVPATPSGASHGAAAILDMTVRELKASINTLPVADLREAMSLELARTDDTPRKSWVDVIQAHLPE